MILPDGLEEGQIRLCNACDENLIVWLEPWAQEFVVPVRSTLTLCCETDIAGDPIPEIDANDHIITIWGRGGSRISVFIDDVDQESFSAGYAAPDMGSMSSRNFVDLVFGDHPETRPGGLPLAASKSPPWWVRLFRRF